MFTEHTQRVLRYPNYLKNHDLVSQMSWLLRFSSYPFSMRQVSHSIFLRFQDGMIVSALEARTSCSLPKPHNAFLLLSPSLSICTLLYFLL